MEPKQKQCDDMSDYYRTPNEFEKASRFTIYTTYFSWFVLIAFAHFREFLRKIGAEVNHAAVELEKQRHFAPLYIGSAAVYARNCYRRVRDVFERPICGVPGAQVKLLDRYSDDYCWTFKYPGSASEVINVGSYNYLGFAENYGFCSDAAIDSIEDEGVGICSTVHAEGLTKTQWELEKLLAQFLRVEDVATFNMGYATNSLHIMCLVDKESLIISDELNHASIIQGCRASGATICRRRHNDTIHLEQILRESIIYGNRKTSKPFNKILIIVEGIYSMEGSICDLAGIIALKRKYGAYLYLDEAHSIGALGKSGRGVVEYWGCDPNDVDILMGTFTKSFGAAGGYIGGKKQTIDYIRLNSAAYAYGGPMSPPVAKQVLTSLSILMNLEGTGNGERRIKNLLRNTHYFRKRVKQMGFIVHGSDDSPVVPILIYRGTTCGFWGREMLKMGIAIVVVSAPATKLAESRARICLSAGHTIEMLDRVLDALREVGTLSNSFHSSKQYKMLQRLR